MSFFLIAFLNLATISHNGTYYFMDSRDITWIYEDYVLALKELDIAGAKPTTSNKFDLITKLHKDGVISYDKRLTFQRAILLNEEKSCGEPMSDEEYILQLERALKKAQKYDNELKTKFYLTPFNKLREEIESAYELEEISAWDFLSLETFLLKESRRESRELYYFEPKPKLNSSEDELESQKLYNFKPKIKPLGACEEDKLEL